MKLLQALLLDFGTYASVMAVFAALACMRANPVRALNRIMAAALATIGVWQLFVALARTTRDYTLWGTLCLPIGSILVVQLFLLHDACVEPTARLRDRLRRNGLAWLTAVAFALGAILAQLESTRPTLYPLAFRLVALVALALGLNELRDRYNAARVVNAHEILLFRYTLVAVMAIFGVFMLIRTPLSSRLNTMITIVFLSGVIALQLSERVFDVAGTAKIAFGYVVRVAITVVLLLPLAALLRSPADGLASSPWAAAVLLAMAAFPVVYASDWITRRALATFTRNPEPAAREAALHLLTTANTETEIIQGVTEIAKRYLGGLAVTVSTRDSEPRQPADGRELLITRVTRRWLTPESALRQYRGTELDRLHDAFAAERLGAVLREAGRKVVAVMCVGQRSGGTKAITPRELEFLAELLAIAATALDRLRLVEDSFRIEGLATVGRLAADFSHTAKNQIAAIQALVEAVKEGNESQLTPEFRDAVYEETLSLAASHNMALEITRLNPHKVDVASVDLAAVVQSVVSTLTPFAGRQHGMFTVDVPTPGLQVRADERVLRQVLVNLLRNAVQACAAAAVAPHVVVRAHANDRLACVDIIDNGPGVAPEAYDRLFTPWATTKVDGTGLGLSFCRQAMRTMGGDVSYRTARGAPHAWFRVELPRE